MIEELGALYAYRFVLKYCNKSVCAACCFNDTERHRCLLDSHESIYGRLSTLDEKIKKLQEMESPVKKVKHKRQILK